jgi:hypothetical protein
MIGVIMLLLPIIVGGCTRTVPPPVFDGGRAFKHLQAQVSCGSRVPGSEASATFRDILYNHCNSAGLEVDSQPFLFADQYSGMDIRMVNVIGRFRDKDVDALPILLVAHYDSRPRTDFHSIADSLHLPLTGANDGASGVAVLMELANLFKEHPPEGNVDLLFTDGEDWGREGDHDNYLLGSRHFARQGIRGKYRFGIVIDLVGDKDQQIYRESYSERLHPELNDMIWSAADSLGVRTFQDSVKFTILDDHLPLNAAGVPTVVLIDFDFPLWHTELDTPKNCSAESLENVGRVLTEIVYNTSLWP